MSRHVIRTFRIMGPAGVLRRKSIERGGQIVEHRGIGVFLNRERGRGVANEQRHYPLGRTGLLHEGCDFAGQIDEARSASFDRKQ